MTGVAQSAARGAKVCPLCAEPMPRRVRGDVFHCAPCGLWASEIPAAEQKSSFDEASREAGLVALRRRNFGRILRRLDARGGIAGRRVLDVGCAHGWFLELARSREADATGIEPDPEIALLASRVAPTRVGYFPAVLTEDEVFDVVVFNDVLEHIPDLDGALDACRRHLSPGGTLVVNLPLNDGVLYRLATGLARLGVPSFFDRMWQRGFPSPHVWYFNRRSLVAAVERRGFELESFSYLETMVLDGLWSRVAMSRGGMARRVVSYAGLLCLYPLVKWVLPGDIGLFVFSKPARAESRAREAGGRRAGVRRGELSGV